jgi:hypothetical protein
MPRPRASAPADPDRLTLADLRHALDQKERELRELLARRDALADDLEELGETLQAMLAGSNAPAHRAPPNREKDAEEAPRTKVRRSRRIAQGAPREGSLQTAIRAVLERVIGPLKVAEIVEAVRKSGYASKSANLNVIVSNRLAQMDDVEKVDRGLYQLARHDAHFERHDVAPAAPPADAGTGDTPPLVKAASA